MLCAAGEKVAQYASRNLHKVVVRRPEYEKGRIPEAMQQACLELDRMMLSDDALKDDLAGTTAIMALFRSGTLFVVGGRRSRRFLDLASGRLSHVNVFVRRSRHFGRTNFSYTRSIFK